MPELPDIEAYLIALRERTQGQTLAQVRIGNPFLLRSVEPPVAACHGQEVLALRRIGKRIVFEFPDELYAVVHLMIAGRFHWRKPGAGLPGKAGLAAFDFAEGSLVLTEAGSKRRASLHMVQGEENLGVHDRGGREVLGIGLPEFETILRSENHTLKRTLVDPKFFSGIGNAYSDEILHAAGLSPLLWTTRMTDEQVATLHAATQSVLTLWCQRLAGEARNAFPEKVTAFRPDFAVHGRYREPCPRCEAPVQRIVYASRETNYCAPCQTGGKLLADRALSTLMKKDWPKTIEQMENKLRDSQ